MLAFPDRCVALFAAILMVACLDQPTAPGRPGPPAAVVIVSGDDQIGTAGEELPQPLVVRVTDKAGGSLADVRVQFRVTAGGGRVLAETAQTDAAGTARAQWILGTAVDQSQA